MPETSGAWIESKVVMELGNQALQRIRDLVEIDQQEYLERFAFRMNLFLRWIPFIKEVTPEDVRNQAAEELEDIRIYTYAIERHTINALMTLASREKYIFVSAEDFATLTDWY